MRIILFILFVSTSLIAGTGSLTSVSGGKVQTSHVNQYYSAFNQDMVPRNSSGVATDRGGDLGTSTYRWDEVYGSVIYTGTAASLLRLDEVSGSLRVSANSIPVAHFGTTGFSGVFVPKSIPTLAYGDSSVTIPKIGNPNNQTSSEWTTYSNSSTVTWSDVGNSGITITTNGRPVMVMAVPANDATTDPCYIGCTQAAQTCGGYFAFMRDSTPLAVNRVLSQAVGATNTVLRLPGSSMIYIDGGLAAGTYTYKLRGLATDGAIEADNCKTFVTEMF